MAFMQAQSYHVSTLAPVHMGTGETFSPMNYVILEGALYHFSEAQLLTALDSAEFEVTGNDAAAQILKLQRRIHEKREALAGVAEYIVPVSPAYEELYTSRIGQVAQREEQGKGILNSLQIERTAVELYSHEPVLVGSGIKGAIRTALLEHLNNGRNHVPAHIYQINGDNKLEKDAGRDLVRLGKQLESTHFSYRNPSQDPMKYLKVSDARPESGVLSEICFTKSVQLQPGREKPPSSVTQRLQVISPFQWAAFSMDVRLAFSGEERLTQFKQTLKSPDADASCLPKTFVELAKRCNAFYLPMLNDEIERNLGNQHFQANARSPDWLIALHELLAGELGQALANGQAFLLNLGKHGGALLKTLNGTRAIKILKAKQRSFRPMPSEERLAAQKDGQTSSLMPFGWVLLHQANLALPQCEQHLKKLLEPRVLLQDDINRKNADRRLAAQKTLQASKEASRKAEVAAAAAAQAEAEQQAMLANMTPEQKQLHALCERMRQGEGRNQGPGCKLAQDLGSVVAGFVNADSNSKMAALTTAREIYSHLGVDLKKNKKVKEKLDQLR